VRDEFMNEIRGYFPFCTDDSESDTGDEFMNEIRGYFPFCTDDIESDTGEVEGEMDDETLPCTSLQSRTKEASHGDGKRKTAFMEEYSAVLDKELNSSSLGKSFVRSETSQGTSNKVILLLFSLLLLIT
jgi:hypothetical protein